MLRALITKKRKKWKEAVLAVLNIKFRHMPQKRGEEHNCIT